MLSKTEIKNLRALHQKKFRDQENRLLVEGERLIVDLLERHEQYIERIFVSKSFDFQHIDFKAIEVEIVENAIFEQLASSKSPQGILALVKYPEQKFEDDQFILVLDGVQDPGNFGTIIRTMAWFGIRQIVCSENTVDFCNPKVVQASMGSVYDLNIYYQDLSSFLAKQNRTIYGALLEGESIFSANLRIPAILIMGNEGNGISDEVKKFITHPLSIPKYGVGESLNVASATSIMLGTFISNVL